MLHDKEVSLPAGMLLWHLNMCSSNERLCSLQVCNDLHFDDPEAQVACHQLGYTSGHRAPQFAFPNNSNPAFALNGVDCSGSESSLNQCAFKLYNPCTQGYTVSPDDCKAAAQHRLGFSGWKTFIIHQRTR